MLTSTSLTNLLPIKQVSDYEYCLRVATDLFVAQGYAATTFADIARACQWNSQTLRLLFGSKKAIALASLSWIIKDCQQQCFVPINRQVLEGQQQTPDALKAIEQRFLLPPFCLLPLILAAESVFHAQLKPYFAQWVGTVHSLLPRQNEATNWQASQALMSQLYGSLLTAHVAQDIIRHKEAVRIIIHKLASLVNDTAVSPATCLTLAAAIAHEVRSPLAGVSLYMDVLIQQLSPEKTSSAALSSEAGVEMHQSLQGMQCAINNIAEMAGLTLSTLATIAGKESPAPLPVLSMRTCLLDIVEHYQYVSESGEIQLFEGLTIPEQDDFLFQGHPLLMERIVTNLLDNAIAVASKEAVLKIDITLASTEQGNVVRIKDDGKGLSAREQQYLFTAFYSNRPNGTGIGLAFCRILLESWNASIACHSVKGQYTLFSLQFPKVPNRC